MGCNYLSPPEIEILPSCISNQICSCQPIHKVLAIHKHSIQHSPFWYMIAMIAAHWYAKIYRQHGTITDNKKDWKGSGVSTWQPALMRSKIYLQSWSSHWGWNTVVLSWFNIRNFDWYIMEISTQSFSKHKTNMLFGAVSALSQRWPK